MIESNAYTNFYISGQTTVLTDLMPRKKSARNTRHGMCIMLIDSGQARIQIDGVIYLVSQNSVIILLPFHSIGYDWQSDDFSFRYLYFDFDFVADFPLLLPPENAEKFNTTPYLSADDASFCGLRRCYDTILEYSLMMEHPYRMGIIKAQIFVFVSDLLFRLAHSTMSPRNGRAEILTADFFRLLHRYHNSERSLAFYAEKLCITTKYLSKVIRRVTAHTVYFWIEEFTIKQAKQLLCMSEATVTEIAEELNFANSSFFAKFFRRHTGYSPSEFRRNKLTHDSIKDRYPPAS